MINVSNGRTAYTNAVMFAGESRARYILPSDELFILSRAMRHAYPLNFNANVEDGLEVRTIRREQVNRFCDWKEDELLPFSCVPFVHERARTAFDPQNDAIASPQTNDPQASGPVTQGEDGKL